jgi:uncharacterized SAM-binding protein YcdF (DUF218 family)
MLGLAKRVKAKILQASTSEVCGQWAGMGLGLFWSFTAPRLGRGHMLDGLDLQRLVTALIMPLPLGLVLAGMGLVVLAVSRWRRCGVLLVGGGLAMVLLASLPAVARTLMAELERPYPPRPAAECPRADAIVVLGGAVQPWLVGDERPRLHRGSDRVWEAARLWHAGCAPRVLVSAGGKVEPPVVAAESLAIGAVLTDLGVPAAALVLEADSRNTQGNATFSRERLAPLGVKRVLLVTSAWHLRRAAVLFAGAGFEVLPWGADNRSFGACRGMECWVPSAGALEMTGLAFKEWLGYWMQVVGMDR